MTNYYLSANEINKLKEDLMFINKKSHSYSIISSEYYKNGKIKKSDFFEENIKNTLKNILIFNYWWKQKKINRKF